MQAGDLRDRIQFWRKTETAGALGLAETWAAFGGPVWAHKRDVSDIEKARAAEVQASLTARFTVRYSAFSAGITPRDRLVCGALTYEITGIREVVRRAWLEINAVARPDQ